MPFDRKHYREIKAFMLYELNHTPFQYTGKCPFTWAKSKLPLISLCVQNEDYEGAAACRDAFFEFVNKFLPEADQLDKKNDLINLPKYIELKIHGHLSL